MTALLTDRVFWPSHSVEMSGLYRVVFHTNTIMQLRTRCFASVEKCFRGA